MDNCPKPSVVLFACDVARVSVFYRELAAMQVAFADDDHVVLSVAGFELVVHRLFGEPEPSQDTSGVVTAREDSYSKLCLPVSDLEEARTTAARLGGSIKPQSFEWSARGFRACDGHDPEGNIIQVRQAQS
ncbi:hypothetical protein GC170_21205 [bacterium]|nr:hypothetical protein [bacterium]